MSEFSESFHFPSGERDEVAGKLEHAGMNGALYGPSETGWLTFIPFDNCPGHQFLTSPRTTFGGRLSQITGTPVLIWFYAEDHEWHTVLWRDQKRVAKYDCDWNNDDVEVIASDADIEAFMSLPKRAGQEGAIREALARALEQEALLRGAPRAYRFAEALGLPHYQWASSQYLTIDYGDQADEDDEDRVFIGEP